MNSELVEAEIENASKNSENENTENTVVVPIKTKNSNTVNAVLTGDIVDLMEKNDFNLSVVTENVEYIIPAEDITINKVAEQLQVKEEELVNIEVRVNIEDVEKKIVDSMMLEAADNNISIVFPPVSFNIEAITTDSAGKKQTVKVDTFSNYVQRVLEIPDDIDPSKITTGIVYNADGTFSHIPTYVYQENGKYYAKLNSKTNSSYSVVWNPIKVESVKNHWSQKSVEDLASRLIIDEIDHFMPDEEISRVEFTKYIIKGLGLYRSETSEKTDFSDVTEDMNVVVSTGVKYGIINGYDDGTFKPNKTISRQEAITIVRKAMKLVAPMQIDLERIEKYDDYDKIENWAFEATKIVVGAGVFNGKTNNVLDPNANMTYAETIQAIENLLIKAKLINE